MLGSSGSWHPAPGFFMFSFLIQGLPEQSTAGLEFAVYLRVPSTHDRPDGFSLPSNGDRCASTIAALAYPLTAPSTFGDSVLSNPGKCLLQGNNDRISLI